MQPAADGKLPDLHLDEDQPRRKQRDKSSSINPLVLIGALILSALLSIVLMAIDLEGPTAQQGGQKARMRYLIEKDYFGAGNIDDRELDPYQLLLREAQRAYSRGDHETERENYRRVLNMLRAERAADQRGLTGGRRRDKQLEEAISVLLSD